MLENKYIITICNLLSSIYLIIQMSIGAVYYQMFHKTGQSRSLLRSQFPQFVDSRDTHYSVLVILLFLNLTNIPLQFVKFKLLPTLANLLQTVLLLLYIVSAIIFVTNSDETYAQNQIILFSRFSRTDLIGNVEPDYLSQLDMFYRFYVMAFVGLFIVPSFITISSLIHFQMIKQQRQQVRDDL